MSHDLDDTIISAWASHMLWLHHGLQSALSYPFSVISSPLSSLPLSLSLSFQHKQHHTECSDSTHSLSLPAPLLGLPPLITVCSYKNKTHGWKDVQFWHKMRRHRFIMSFSPSLFSLSLSFSVLLTHRQTHTHRCNRIKWLSQQCSESSTYRHNNPCFPSVWYNFIFCVTKSYEKSKPVNQKWVYNKKFKFPCALELECAKSSQPLCCWTNRGAL